MVEARPKGLAGLLLFVLGALVIIGQFGRFAMHAYRIPSEAMEPTLHCARPDPPFIQPESVGCEGDTEDRVLVPRFLSIWTPSRGDIVVFTTPPEAVVKCGSGGTFVKRLIGLPDETITEKNGLIFVDGKRLVEPYVKPALRDSRSASWKVPKGTYLFMGDNRANSCDSRYFGSVPRRNLIGPVVARYWPLDRIGSL